MKILLCSNGREAAGHAIRFIAALAPAWEAEVVLLGIAERAADEAALRAALERGAEILRERKVPVEIAVGSGAPLAQIRRHTRAKAYDLLAVGTMRGRRGILSQKACDLVREVDLPVMVVPESDGRLPHQAPGAGRVLMCSGGRKCVEPAVQLAVRLALKPKLPVTLLHVLPDAPALYANLVEREIDPDVLLASRSALAANLRQECEGMKAAGLEVMVRLRLGSVSGEILEEARTGKYDLIVMGAAPAQGAVRTYVLGNVAAAVIKETEIPVVMVRTGEAKTSWWSRLFRKK